MTWIKKKLGEVLTIERGGSPRPIDKYLTNSPDGINWIKISDATASDKCIFETKEKITKEGLHKTRMVNEGDFILSNSMSFGRPYIMKTSGCIHDGWLVLKEKGQKIFDTEFLYYLLSSPYVFNQFDYLAAGSTVRNLNIALVSSVEVPIPPLPEQQRIVSILDEAFAAIARAKANAEQNLKNAKELFESYLQGVFEKKGDGWEEKRFEELIQENQIGLIKSTKEQGNDKPYRYLKMDSITSDNNLIHDRYVYVDADKSELEKFTLNEGDFLFNTRNSYELVGKTCVFSPIDDEPTLFNNNIMRVVFKNDISSRFINYAFSSELVKERLQKLKSGTTSVVGIYYKGLRNLKIPVTKYKEQQTIVRQLDALRAETQKLETIYQQKLLNLEELKKSVLQRAFAGELT